MAKLYSETRQGLDWRILVHLFTYRQPSRSLQSVSDHNTYTIQRWTIGAAQYCLHCEVGGLLLQVDFERSSGY